MSSVNPRGQASEVSVTGGKIRYRVTGEGRPIVFIHGYYVNGDLWRDVVAELSGDAMCITPDLPLASHELAMDADADLTPTGVAHNIAELIDALGLEDVVLVGNDSGGALCQLVITSRPERIGALVITPCDAFEKFPPFPYSLIRYMAKLPGSVATTNALLSTKFGRWFTFRPLLKRAYDDALVKSWTEPARRDKGVARDGAKFIAGAHPRLTKAAAEKLPNVTQPALMIWPPDCTFFKFSLAERLAQALPNARIAPLDDAWTFAPLDQPQRVAKEIREFAVSSAGSAEPAQAAPGVTR